MKIVIDIPEGDYNYIKGYGVYAFVEFAMNNSYAIEKLSQYAEAIKNGTPLPEGAEILTKEAYSDLCLRASHERKTGRWIEHDDFDNSWECSVCNEVVDIIEGTPMDNEYRFCPWCGAEMKGGAE